MVLALTVPDYLPWTESYFMRQQAARIVEREEGGVDNHSNDVEVVLEGGAAAKAATTATTFQSNLDSHG